VSTTFDARATARGEAAKDVNFTSFDPLIVGAEALPSRRAFLGRLVGLAGAALAVGAAAGAAGPVLASAVLPAPMAPLSPALRRWTASVATLIEDGLRDLGPTFVAVFDPRRGMIYFRHRREAAHVPADHVVLPDDAPDQLRAILAADAAGGPARG
jgi:hypothetical protein